MSTIFEEINRLTPQELENAGILTRAKKSGWVCPICNSGSHEKGTGLNVIPNSNRLKCHVCGKSFSAFDVLAAHYGYDGGTTEGRKETIERAKERFKVPTEFSPFKEEQKKDSAPMTKTEPQKNYSEFYKIAQSQLESFIESQGGKFRGLSLDDWREVGAGIATAADLKSVSENIPARARCLILPYDSRRFLVRSISDNPKVKRGNTGGKKTRIYNPYGVNFEKALFVVEGEIDAISIHKAGFPAVALGGAGEYKKLIENLKGANKAAVSVILMFDNNDGGTGQKDATAAKSGLLKEGYKAVNFILSLKEKYDSNEFLQKDFEGFQKRLQEIYTQATADFKKMESERMKAAGIEILADVFDELDAMSDKLKGNLLKWGFPALDEKLPMLPGCYLLGALPSLGKTTLALNVAGNICEQGEAVLYISYEPTSKQIAAKNLAGYWFKKIWNNHRDNRLTEKVPTAAQIMLGRYSGMFSFEEMKVVREELKAKRRNFYFLQGRKDTAQDLISKIKPYVDNGVKFIVVDYIQLIKGTDTTKTAREQIDETIKELQIFQSDNNLVILFISSFNRENYRNYACLEAFKESGGLEFTADGILALQLEYKKGESRISTEKFQEKKQMQPRDMELVCLKNRFGIDFTDKFAYHSAHETFIEKTADSENATDDEIDKD